MSDSPLFHAYIVSGKREDARDCIAAMLAPFTQEGEGFEYVASEHVSFAIEDARALREWQGLATLGPRKVRVVYADFMTREAQNALLKIFEEPVERTHIILAIPNPDALFSTLLSRAQIVSPRGVEDESKEARDFLLMSRAERLAYIAKIVEKSDDEEAAAEVRERTIALLNGLEKTLAKDAERNQKILASILRFKPYLYIPGASSRMIAETLALCI